MFFILSRHNFLETLNEQFCPDYYNIYIIKIFQSRVQFNQYNEYVGRTSTVNTVYCILGTYSGQILHKREQYNTSATIHVSVNFKSKGRRNDHRNFAGPISQFSNHTLPFPYHSMNVVGTNWHGIIFILYQCHSAYCIHNTQTFDHGRITVMRLYDSNVDEIVIRSEMKNHKNDTLD